MNSVLAYQKLIDQKDQLENSVKNSFILSSKKLSE